LHLPAYEGSPGQIGVLNTHHASAFGAEKRLDHYVAAKSQGFHGGIGVLADDGGGYPMPAVSKRALARYLSTQFRLPEWIQDNFTPAAFQPMQHIHAKDYCSRDPGGIGAPYGFKLARASAAMATPA